MGRRVRRIRHQYLVLRTGPHALVSHQTSGLRDGRDSSRNHGHRRGGRTAVVPEAGHGDRTCHIGHLAGGDQCRPRRTADQCSASAIGITAVAVTAAAPTDFGGARRTGAAGSDAAEHPAADGNEAARDRGDPHTGDAFADQRRAAPAQQSALTEHDQR
jgi:hypothetical protein